MKHHHSHIALLAVALSVTLVVYALYGFMRYKIDVSLEKAISARDLARSEEINKREEQNLNALHDETEDDRAALSTFFISDTRTLPFIESIESLGSRAGSAVELSSIGADPLEDNATGSIRHIKVHVDAVGTWQAVVRTLMLAEVLPFKASVSKVHLEKSGEIDGKTAWKASFLVDAALIHGSL